MKAAAYARYSTDRQTTGTACHQSDHTNDQDDQPCAYDWCCGNVESGTADYRGKQNDKSECGIWRVPCCIRIVFSRMLANQYACKIFGKKVERSIGKVL